MSLERTEQEHLVLPEIGRDESVTLLIQFSMLLTLQVTKHFLPIPITSLLPKLVVLDQKKARGKESSPFSWSEVISATWKGKLSIWFTTGKQQGRNSLFDCSVSFKAFTGRGK